MTYSQLATGWAQEGTLAQRAITPVHPNGHPKVHFGTIVEGSQGGGGGGGGGGCTGGPPDSLIIWPWIEIQRHERSKTSVYIISHRSQLILIKTDMLLATFKQFFTDITKLVDLVKDFSWFKFTVVRRAKSLAHFLFHNSQVDLRQNE